MNASDRLPAAFARLDIHYGWAIVGVIFLTMLATSAAMGMISILMLPLKTEFGWDLGAISSALALRVLLYGMVGPLAAAILQRYGVRLVVCSALALIVVGLALSAGMTALWQLWLSWGLMIGLASGVTANILGATIAAQWFTEQRGLVIGLLSASNAAGQLLFLPTAAWLSDHLGWRYAMMPAGVICLVCLVLVMLVVRDRPGDVGLTPYGEKDAVPVPPRRPEGWGRSEERKGPEGPEGNVLALSFSALAEAAGNRTFWILAGTFFVCGLSTSGLVQNHFVPLCSDFGITMIAASSILALMGGFNFIGTILSGWLSDRYDNRYLLFWYYGLRGLSLLALPYTDFTIYGLSIFAVFYGLDWIATIPPTVRMTNQEFGREKGPIVFGWIFLSHQVGSAVAAYGAGVSRDALLTYLPAFTMAGAACLIAAGAILTLRQRAAAERAA